ncbi:hypothetical protein [Luteibacter sp. 329MFSha]|uniref:hypothetical protein n=1 Tax=Luteibacter sp. 329MFSha TaxID=1798239 RepID=UPI0008D4F19E|nr:hypothetical protein [Luteibacter sp. 329MFSha]SEV91225.1 Uncharacterized conserved protein [Luteibacter sp. 329MFSha]
MSQNLKSFGATLALLATCPAIAADREANFTGPLVTPAVNSMPAGMVNIEPYLIHTNTRGSYTNAGDRKERDPTVRQWQLAVPMSYALTDTSFVQLTLNASRTSGDGLHTDGMRMGDTSVRFQQRLRAPDADGGGLVLAIAAAQRLPTGAYHHLDTNPLNGTGNGAMRTTLAFGAQQLHWLDDGHALRWRAQLAWSPSPGRINVRDGSVYGTSRGFRGYARLGQAWNASVAAEYVLDPRWVLVGEAIWNRSGAVDVVGATAEGPRTARRLAPSQEFSLAPAVEYHFSPTVGLIGGVQFTVAGRNTADYVAPQVALNMVF